MGREIRIDDSSVKRHYPEDPPERGCEIKCEKDDIEYNIHPVNNGKFETIEDTTGELKNN